MGVFDDKKFDQLDWMSQAIEPIDSKMNEMLGKLPDELIIDFNKYMTLIERSYHLDLSVDTVIQSLLGEFVGVFSDLTYTQLQTLRTCFKFEIEGEKINIDFEKKAITGGLIKFVKTTNTIDEKILSKVLGTEGINQAAKMFIDGKGNSRANEIMELLGKCEAGLRTRSARLKRKDIVNRLREIFKTNEWNIRDTELADKVGTWIRLYVSDGNLAAYSNFCRLKVMTHKGQAIYSMEEVE